VQKKKTAQREEERAQISIGLQRMEERELHPTMSRRETTTV